jgi:putative ABC transport system ATP-binding protein
MLRDLAHAEGRAVVIVTHDTRAMEFADRIIKIQDGRVADADAGDAADAFRGMSSHERRELV